MNFYSSANGGEPSRSARRDEVWRRPPFRAAIALLAFVAAMAIARATAADCTHAIEKKILGVPIWSTSPNEGNTWGAMPILLGICPDDHHTSWLLAPSMTWNSSIRLTGTVRWYQYPDPDTTLTVILSGSTHVNFVLYGAWQHLPTAEGEFTDEAVLRVDRSLFARFFGLGPDTPQSAESSYTLFRAFATERRGINVGDDLNLGLTIGFEHDGVDDIGVSDLPLAPEVFPDAPGMHGATLATQGIDLRYDTRPERDFSDRGVRVELWGALVEGLSRSPTFARGGIQASGLWPELDWLSGAARGSWRAVSSSSAPFYQQTSLGGSMYLRGFEEGRFVDRQAWTVEVEQRIRVLRTNLLGITADWRVDPFVNAGQVFGDFAQIVSKPQIAAGVGLRVFVHPSLVGRVDLADGGEGLKVYVEIGYPY